MSDWHREQHGILVNGKAPIPKVIAAGAAGALTVLLVWVAGIFGLEVPEEVAAAVAWLLATGAAYLKR